MEQNNKVPIPQREIIQSFLITTARFDFNVYEKRILSRLITHLQFLLEGKKLRGRVERSLFGDILLAIPLSFFSVDDITNYKRYKEAFKSLAKKGIEFEDEKTWCFINLIQSPRIDKNSGIVQFTLCHEIVDLFLNFSKGYSKYFVEVSCSLRSTASARLYELISNQPRPFTYPLDKLKKMLDPEEIYLKTSNFMQKVIHTAQKELDEKANWSFTYEPVQAGRKYIGLKIFPYPLKNRVPVETERKDLIRRLSASNFIETDMRNYLYKVCGFSQKELKNNLVTIQHFATLYGANAVNKLMEIYERATSAKNPKGYIIKSMQLEIENY